MNKRTLIIIAIIVAAILILALALGLGLGLGLRHHHKKTCNSPVFVYFASPEVILQGYAIPGASL